MLAARRTWLLGAGLTVTTAGLLTSGFTPDGAETAEQIATGVVFNDLDGDGVRDHDEPGVLGVAVSNGRDVVRTNMAGRYRLSVDDQTVLFITKPADYMVPVNEVQLPQFYYLHYPDGSPYDLRYGGVESTGPLPDSVDFALTRTTKSAEFSALAFADPQTSNRAELADMERDVVAELIGATEAAFGVTAGDVVNDPLDLFQPHNEIVAKIGIPWWNVPGNHDMDFDAPDDANATDTFKSVYGPTNYSFDYGRVHFVALDNVEFGGSAPGNYRGFLNDEQLTWLENDLALVSRTKLVVLVTHIPLQTDATTSTATNTVNVRALLRLLRPFKHVYSLSGHDTSNSWQMYLGPEDGWYGRGHFHHQVLAEVRGGGWTTGPFDGRGIHAADMADGNPNGYYTIEFDGVSYTPRYQAASLPADFQLRLSLSGGKDNKTWLPSGPSGSGDFPEPVEFRRGDWSDGVPTPTLTANVFDGGERHTVKMRVDRGRFVPMRQLAPRNDPYITALAEQYAGTVEAPAAPEPSSHLWSRALPRNLRPGEHTVTVRSTDPYGQVSKSVATFRVR